MDCEGVPVSDDSISFAQCCFGLSAVSFALPGRCSLCPTPSASKFSIINYLTSSAITYICRTMYVHWFWVNKLPIIVVFTKRYVHTILQNYYLTL